MKHVLMALATACATLAPVWAVADTTPNAQTRQSITPTEAETQALDILSGGDLGRAQEARRLLEIAAEAGLPEGTNALSFMLRNGIGGPADLERGRALLERAAQGGSVGANLTLADAHIEGRGGYPRDPERGYAYAVAAAESTINPNGAAFAQWRVGMLTLEGVGTPADAERAYTWVARAAENGAVYGMISRAVMLATGDGVAIDGAAARLWYQRAAESGEMGSAHALRSLGGMLARGEGGSIDLPRGYAYLAIARDAGDPLADDFIRRLAFTDEDRAAAEAIMRDWRASHPVPLPSE